MTPAERMRMLQQHSQFFGGGGPVLVGNQGAGPEEEEAALTLPGYEPPARPSPARAAVDAARAVSDRRNEDRANAAAAEKRAEQSTMMGRNLRRQGYQAAADVGADLGVDQRAADKVRTQRNVWDTQVSDADPIAQAPDRSALTPSEATALRKKYEQSGHTQNMTFEDWYDENFSDADGVDTVRSAAMATPRIQAGKDPILPPGERSRLADSRVAAGKPLPEGRDIDQYTPEQRRTMQRNVINPEVPMNRFGGTFTHNPNGSLSSRAPDPEMLRTAAAIATDPEQGNGSASHIMALAQAYGIDAQQYGDDMDMLKADVMREKERHDQIGAKYDIVDNGMGGFRYVPNTGTMDKMARYEAVQRSDRIGKRFAGMLSPEEEAELDSVAGNMNQRLMLKRNRAIAQTVRNRTDERNMTIAMNNPRQAQGVYFKSLQDATRSGDPLAIANVHEAFGNERAARDYRSLAGTQAQAAADVAAAEAGARADDKGAPEQGLLADTFAKEVNAALQSPDPRVRKLTVMAILQKSQFLPPEEIAKEADALIASASGGALTPQHTRTWFEYLFGPRQAEQGVAAPPQQAAAAPPAAPAGPAAPAAPPASGRGASLNATMDWLQGNRPQLPNRPHPYRRGS